MANPERGNNPSTPENPNNGFSIEIKNSDKIFDLLKNKQFQQGFDYCDGNNHCFDELSLANINDDLIKNLDISITGLNNETIDLFQEYNLILFINRQTAIGNRTESGAPLDESKRYLTEERIRKIQERMLQCGVLSTYSATKDGDQRLLIKKNKKTYIVRCGYNNDLDWYKACNPDKPLPQTSIEKSHYIYLNFHLLNENSQSDKVYENYIPLTTKEDFQSTLSDFSKIAEILIKSMYYAYEEKEPNLKLLLDYPEPGEVSLPHYSQMSGAIRKYNNPNNKIINELNLKTREVKFNSSSGKIQESSFIKTNFDSIAGQSKAVAEAKKLVLAINHPEIYEKRGVKLAKGILFYGPPGTGKTLIAKAIASEVNAELFEVSFSDIGSKWYGESEQRIQEIFNNANKVTKTGKKAIILFDELDSMAPSRNNAYEGSKKIVSIMLQNLDGFRSNKDVIIIGTTNRPEDIDPALKRPGRIDKIISVDLPGLEDRQAILQLHINKAIERSTESHGLFSPDLNIKKIAESTNEMSGADLTNIINLTLESKTILELEGFRWTPITNTDIENTLAEFNLKKKEKNIIGFNG